jgi:hypothetical protein
MALYCFYRPACITPSRVSLVLLAALILLINACSPTFNWREVRPDETRLALLLPCKPDKAEKMVPLGGRPTALRLLGCDAGGATFAVAVADLGDASRASEVLTQWQALTLANMKAGAPQVTALKLKGAAPSPAPVLVKAQGQRADGTAVSGQAAYFAQGTQVFQAVVYASKLAPDVAETYFASLSFE